MQQSNRKPSWLSNFIAPIVNNCSKFAQYLLPQACILCSAPSQNRKLCSPCQAALPYMGSACPNCATPTLNNELCGQCLTNPPNFERCVSSFSYVFPMDALIQSLKYAKNFAVVDIFADALADKLTFDNGKPAETSDGHWDNHKPELLIPMPLHRQRLKQRGFNQSVEITRALSARLRIPYSVDICERVRDTPPQTGLPWKDRAKNIRGAFTCSKAIDEKNIAIIDDVMTTGATANELAKICRKQGAKAVSVWVVARTLPP